ncbi:hypothetical protein HRbin14_01642 [bacterium HR14]|nr:hypothetical protein HRbin14_01642 [bacterium HR14]
MILICGMMLNDFILYPTSLFWDSIFIPSIIPTTPLTHWLLAGRYACLPLRFPPCGSAGTHYTLFRRLRGFCSTPLPLRKPQSPTSPACEQPIVNRPNHMTRQIPFITRIARLPGRQV